MKELECMKLCDICSRYRWHSQNIFYSLKEQISVLTKSNKDVEDPDEKHAESVDIIHDKKTKLETQKKTYKKQTNR